MAPIKNQVPGQGSLPVGRIATGGFYFAQTGPKNDLPEQTRSG